MSRLSFLQDNLEKKRSQSVRARVELYKSHTSVYTSIFKTNTIAV